MIISASRRSDIPTYYAQWFFNRIKEGFVLVPNPMNIHQVSRIKLTPDVVDCIVFWTKNPAPMLNRLDELKEYLYYFQFTLNSYGREIEENIPSKNDEVIHTFKTLSDKIGSQRVIWRYDPILLNDTYDINYHLNYFEKLARKLNGYTQKCTISFVDFYRNTTNNVKELRLKLLTKEDKRTIAKGFADIASNYGFYIDTCAEDIELCDLNISHARCIDDRMIEKIVGCKMNVGKDKGQRPSCGCVESIDIGMYNTCKNGCKYCYANYSASSVEKNCERHDPKSPLLSGTIGDDDVISERPVKSNKDIQISF